VVDDQDGFGHFRLIRSAFLADNVNVRQDDRDAYQAWLVGEILLFGLLGASLALFLTHTSLHTAYALPHLRLVLQTVIVLAAGLVAILAGAPFSADGRRDDLLRCLGCFVPAASPVPSSRG